MTPTTEVSADSSNQLAALFNPPTAASDEINLRELFEVVASGKWLVFAVFAVVVAIGAAYAFLATPIFEATGIVQVEKEKGVNASVDQISSLLTGRPAEAEAEVAIIKSRMVLSPVIDTLLLRIQASPRRFPLIGAAIARLHKYASSPVSAWPGFGRFGWGGESIRVTALEVPAQLENKQLTLVYDGAGFKLLDQNGTQLLSGKVGERAETDIGEQKIEIFIQSLVARPGTQFELMKIAEQTAYASVLGAIDIEEQPRESGVIQFKVKSSSPLLAAKLLNEIENSYIRQNVERRSADAAKSLQFLQDQLPALKAKSNAAQAALNAYQLANGAVDVQDETQFKLQQAVNLETARLQLEQQRDAALQTLTPQHPMVTALDSQLKSIQRQEQELEKNVGSLPTKQQEVLSLMRDLDVNTQLYTSVINSIQQYQLTTAGTVGNARVIDTALSPLLPAAPKKGVILAFSVLLGLIAGIASVFLVRSLIKGIDRPEDVERATGLPSYASIPFSPLQTRLVRSVARNEKNASGLLALADTDDIAIESIRSLRTSLHFAMLEAANNVVMITGPVAGLGKSFVSANLSAVLAMSGKKVVIMDADMRRGRLHQYFALNQTPGLSDFVASSASISDIVHSTSVPGLDFIGTGNRPPNPSEIILNNRFADLIEHLKNTYDYVIIDTPPVLPVTDAAVMGRFAGTTMLVLKSAEHPMRVIEESIRRLRQAGVRVSGCIFNQVGARLGSYGYGSYGYTYGYKAEEYGDR